MLYQAFDNAGLQRIITGKDIRRFEEIRGMEDLSSHLDAAAKEVRERTLSFDDLEQFTRHGKTVYTAPDFLRHLILRKLNDNLRRVFKVKQSDRNRLISTVKTLLREKSPYHVIKSDISRFYEAMPRKPLLDEVEDNYLLSYESKWVLRRVFESSRLSGPQGIPRGLGISATLSELHMRYVDQEMRRLPSVFFYGRYVDDIIIFCIHEPDEVMRELTDALRRRELELNQDKTLVLSNETSASLPMEFDFLGYRLTKPSPKEPPTVTIAPKKIRKIKTRIVKSLLDYGRTGDLWLLEARLRFLTSNYNLRQSKASPSLKAGIYFNYPLADTVEQDLIDLDSFLRAQILSKNSIIAKRRGTAHRSIKRRLVKYSFYWGYKNQILHPFLDSELKAIQRCWRDE